MQLEDLKKVLALTASISGILQFLSGTLVCQKIVQKKSTGDMSGFPFICGFLSTSLWLHYGFLIHEGSIVLVNTVGATLQLAYIVTFYVYSIKKSVIVRQFFGCTTVLLLVLLYSGYETNVAPLIQRVGFICCCVTILFFAAPFAGLLHVIRMKNAESLPFPIIFTSLVVSCQWFAYGLLLKDYYIQIPNLLGCLLSAIQLSLFCVYPTKVHSVRYSPLREL